MIGDDRAAPGTVEQVLLCSGKVYYDLDRRRGTSSGTHTAIIRLEQLYPFPAEELRAELIRYPANVRLRWVQEDRKSECGRLRHRASRQARVRRRRLRQPAGGRRPGGRLGAADIPFPLFSPGAGILMSGGTMARRRGSVGYRLVPHTADLRIEAWAPTVERCVAEVVRAMVRSFADLALATPTACREFVVHAADPEAQLITVLDEVIYRMDTDNEIPWTVAVRREGGNLRVTMTMVDVTQATVVGAVPKAVSLHRLRLEKSGENWRCSVTIDV